MKNAKKMLSMVLALVLSLTCWGLPQRAAAATPPTEGIMPFDNSMDNFTPRLIVDFNGNAVLRLSGRGTSNATLFSVSSYLEQEFGGLWVRVSNGEPNSTWHDVQQGFIFAATHSVYVGRDTDCRAVISLRIIENGVEYIKNITIYATFF